MQHTALGFFPSFLFFIFSFGQSFITTGHKRVTGHFFICFYQVPEESRGDTMLGVICFSGCLLFFFFFAGFLAHIFIMYILLVFFSDIFFLLYFCRFGHLGCLPGLALAHLQEYIHCVFDRIE